MMPDLGPLVFFAVFGVITAIIAGTAAIVGVAYVLFQGVVAVLA